MKKFLIGVICIIPIVVVMALSVTSNIITSATPPTPQKMIIRNSDNVEIEEDDEAPHLVIDFNEQNEFIAIDILPLATPDKSIEYERNEEADGAIELEKIEGSSNRYRIIPVEPGLAEIIINPSSNVNLTRTLSVYVAADTIGSTMIYTEEGLPAGIEYNLIKEEKFFLEATPYVALDSSGIAWSVSDESVATVDERNGIVTPLKEGTVDLEAIVHDKAGDAHREVVKLNTTAAVVKKNVVYSSVALGTGELKAKIAVNPDKTVVTDLGSGKFSFERTDKNVKAIVEVKSCSAGELGFMGMPETLYTNNGMTYIRFGVLDGSSDAKPEVVFSSDTPELVSVTPDGTVTALKPGNAVIRATYEGGFVQASVLIKERPLSIALKHRAQDGRLGIQRTRVWGLYWLTDEYQLTTDFDFGIRNDLSGTFDVNWSFMEGGEHATFKRKNNGTNDITITFKDSAVGNKVTISAILVVDKREITESRRSFTFEFRPKKESVNVYSFDELARVLSPDSKYGGEDYNCYDCIMQNDIYATDIITQSCAGVYGNGFLYDGAGIPAEGNEGVKKRFGLQGAMISYCYQEDWCHEAIMEYNRTHKELFEANEKAGIPFTEYTLDYVDIVMRAAENLEDVYDEKYNILKRNAALHLSETWNEIDPERILWDLPPKINIKFLQVSNTVKGVEIEHVSDLLIEGCLMGENFNHSFLITHYGIKYRRPDNPSRVVLRNNVFKSSKGPSVVFASAGAGNDFDENCMPNLKIEGMFDVYNWKTRDEFSNMLADFVLNYVKDVTGGNALAGVLINQLTGPFRNIMREVINDENLDDIFYTYKGTEYVPFGILGVGAIITWNPYPDGKRGKCLAEIDKNSKVAMMEFSFRDKNGKTLPALAGLEGSLLNIMPTIDDTFIASSISKPSYIISSDFSKGPPDIMPFDMVPNSRRLYSKLSAGVQQAEQQ